MSHRKCFRDAAHNATPPPLPPITTHSKDTRTAKVLELVLKRTFCVLLLSLQVDELAPVVSPPERLDLRYNWKTVSRMD
ncbi:hypothetical protein J6590_084317 [Homalodisca vitripennis]|nr:hypothetical protein J6590_084317 [Homalodisca vitripennis]